MELQDKGMQDERAWGAERDILPQHCILI